MKIPRGEIVEGKKGRYEIEREIVSGEMGRLHLAKDQHETPVIVKIPRRKRDGLDHVREDRLKLEGTILRSLWEPRDAPKQRANILRFVDEGIYQGTYFFVSEFVEGGRLKELVGGKPASLAQASSYLKDVIGALSYLHGKNIIHRDINPKNLLVRPTGELVLIDFGLAYYPGQNPVPGGTRPYAGPEQFEDPPRIHESSDIYGVGATTLFLLTGKEPDWLDSEPVSKSIFRDFTRALPTELLNVVETCIQYEPSRRFQSVDALSDDLEKALSGIRTGFLAIGSREFEIFGRTEIGRYHDCDSKCRNEGFKSPPTIAIDDPEYFVSGHHMVVWFEQRDAYLQDSGSKNGTFVKRAKDTDYVFLGSRTSPQKEPFLLKGGDTIALAYDTTIGPHVVIKYRRG